MTSIFFIQMHIVRCKDTLPGIALPSTQMVPQGRDLSVRGFSLYPGKQDSLFELQPMTIKYSDTAHLHTIYSAGRAGFQFF